MDRSKKRLVIVAFFALAAYFGIHFICPSSKFIDFHPRPFPAKTETKFFYSTADELHYSDQIDTHAPTLVRGHIKYFLVSPDREKIAIVIDKQLLVVGTQSILRRVTSVDSLFRPGEPTHYGEQFFRDDDFQWSRDSKSLYLVRCKYFQTNWKSDEEGELWRVDVESGYQELVLKPFWGYEYFFGPGTGIYFEEPTDRGDLPLKFFDGKIVTNIEEPDAKKIKDSRLGGDPAGSTFYSFTADDFMFAAWRPSGPVDLLYAGDPTHERTQTVAVDGRRYLTATEGTDFLGNPQFCIEQWRSQFLPGNRYFLLNVPPYCGNCNRPLLIDTVSGQYQKLPKDTVVYLTENTDSLRQHWVKTSSATR
jgi:hypothetical protein